VLSIHSIREAMLCHRVPFVIAIILGLLILPLSHRNQDQPVA
jgi:hypothetical protein